MIQNENGKESVRILDFGIAMAKGRKSELIGNVVGTSHYIRSLRDKCLEPR